MHKQEYSASPLGMQNASFLHGLIVHAVLIELQNLPVYSLVHVHTTKPFESALQEPPFKHGLLSHPISSIGAKIYS